MNFKRLFAVTGLCTLGLLASCSQQEEQIVSFAKDFAITNLNDKNYTYSTNSVSSNQFVGDYYKSEYGNGYKSIHTGKEISASSLQKRTFGNFAIYEDYNNDNYYDAFGSRIYGLHRVSFSPEVDYMVVAKNSPLYDMLDGEDVDYKNSSELAILQLNNIYGKVAVAELNDTHFKAENVFDYDELKVADNEIIDNITDIEVLNPNEVRVKNYGTTHRLRAKKSTNNLDKFDGNTDRIYETESEKDDSYYNYVNINFSGTTTPFTYGIKKVNGITNNFDFILDGQKYKINTNGSHNKLYILPGYVLNSKDNSYAIVLGKKILEDGNLSNKNYTFVISKDLKVSSGVEETSSFEGNVNYIWNDRVEKIRDNEELLVLNDKCKVIKSDSGIHLYKNGFNPVFVGHPNQNLISTNSINGYYYLNGNSSIIKFNLNGFSEVFNGNAEILDSNYAIWKESSDVVKSSIYIGNERICYVDEDYSYKTYSSVSFGKKTKVASIKEGTYSDATTWIINFTETN